MLGLGAVRTGVKIYVLIDTPKCVRIFTTTIYNYTSPDLPPIVLFSIPNAPVLLSIISATAVLLQFAASASLSATKDSHLLFFVGKSMPPPLIFLTLPPPLIAQPWSIEALSPLVHWCLSSRLHLICRLVVMSPVVVCLRLVSSFVAQPPHASRRW